ncbi:hypothetical protein [Vibrio intestinalis]|uniref:hypothetical protein n=1 Tax=Vibrio intestinalis TaxID=2933291 RepID=UPI0021A276D2|nr:hypothetical protein [Vibrio intestinalis]
MSDNYDHYEEAEKLISLLEGCQMESTAIALRRCLDEGSTGTEIFMSLHWNLGKLLNEEQCPSNVFISANKLWKELDTSLK